MTAERDGAATVLVASNRRAIGSSFARALSQHSPHLEIVTLDLEQPAGPIDAAAAREAFRAAALSHSVTGVAVCLAGDTDSPLGLDHGAWNRAVTSMLRLAFVTIQEAVDLLSAEGGSIVVVNADAVDDTAGSPSPTGAAAWGAVSGLVRHVAREAGPSRVRINSVSALDGVSLAAHATGKRPAELGDGFLADLAPIAAYLLSDAGDFITGTTLEAAVDAAFERAS